MLAPFSPLSPPRLYAHPPMNRRDAYERRVWRLAYLLTGADESAAAALVARVVDAQPDLEGVDTGRLDRLVVLSAREWAASPSGRKRAHGRLAPPTAVSTSPTRPPASAAAGPALPASARDQRLPLHGIAAQALQAAVRLPRQSLEAWILGRIDELDGVGVARAMDCSRTAAQRHLELADRAMSETLGDGLGPAITALRSAVDTLDPGAAVHAYRVVRRRERRIRRAIIAGAAVMAVLAAILAAVMVS